MASLCQDPALSRTFWVPELDMFRLRHPQGKRLQAVSLNRREWTDFDPGQEWVRVEIPADRHYEISGRF